MGFMCNKITFILYVSAERGPPCAAAILAFLFSYEHHTGEPPSTACYK